MMSVYYKMAENVFSEQRIVIKFYVKLGKSFKEIREGLQKVFLNNCPSKGMISKWMNRFIDGREITKDDNCSGRPVPINTESKISATRCSQTVRGLRSLSELFANN